MNFLRATMLFFSRTRTKVLEPELRVRNWWFFQNWQLIFRELLILHLHLPGFVKIWHTACSTASETSIFLQTHKWNFSIKNQQFRTFGKKFEISTFPELYRASYGIFRQTLVGGSVKWVVLSIQRKFFSWRPVEPDMVFKSKNPTFSSFECSTGRQYSICLLILEEGIKIDFQLRGFVIWTYEKKKPRHILIQTSPRIREMTDLNENLQGESCKSKLQNVTPTAVFTGSA